MKNNQTKRRNKKVAHVDPANRDPISGAPGAHPVGAGVGAAAGGATGAAIGAVGGPAGAAVGLVAGGIIGGLAGKAAGESINPSVEDAFWRESHADQTFAKGRPYDDYATAYRVGYEGYGKYGCCGKSFEECEPDLMADYARICAQSENNMGWEVARPATHAAWRRLSDKTSAMNQETEDASDMEAPRFATDPSNRNTQQAGRYEPKERSKP